MPPTHRATPLALFAALIFAACDGGLAPPESRPGSIRGVVTYEEGTTWPEQDSLHDIRFVAMRFIPRDTVDFLQLNRLVFSDRLSVGVASDTFYIPEVEPGVFVYSGVAQKYGPGLFAWRPVGLYAAGGGVFDVRAGQTTEINLHVDFQRLPPFPP
jgi:hypothetical protein